MKRAAWISDVLRGDFEAIPDPFGWEQSYELAHLVDGYAVLGGARSGMAAAQRILREVAQSGEANASALDLWAALFIQHRGYRMSGHGPSGEERTGLDRLCSVLRSRLILLGAQEKIRVLTTIAAAQEPLGGSAWRS